GGRLSLRFGHSSHQEAHMNKLVFAAATALLLATTSAQAGGAVTLQIDGQRIQIESPRGCNSLSCIQINAPGFKGKLGNIDLKGLGSKDKNDDAPAPATTTTTAPVAAAPVAPVAAAPAPAPAPVAVTPAPAPVAAPAPVVTNDITPAPA